MYVLCEACYKVSAFTDYTTGPGCYMKPHVLLDIDGALTARGVAVTMTSWRPTTPNNHASRTATVDADARLPAEPIRHKHIALLRHQSRDDTQYRTPTPPAGARNSHVRFVRLYTRDVIPKRSETVHMIIIF